MSHIVASLAPIASAHAVKRYPGFGILGADIPATGDNGPSPVLNDSPSPSAEYHWRVETAPSAGVLTIYPDLTFEWDSSGAADGSYPWVYRLFENGVNQGTATVSQTLGAAGVSLAIADAAHAHTADALALSTATALSVADALHGHVADNVTLGLAGVASLLIADATHSHAADNIALTSAHSLAIADATHAHTADALTLASAVALVVQDATHAHTAESLILDTSNAIVLTIADALHAHTADSIVITPAAIYLTIADSLHAHLADRITLFAPGADLPDPPARYTIKATPRTREVIAAARSYQVTK